MSLTPTAAPPALATFGRRLAERRRAARLSQSELARRFGTAHSTIGKYERDEMKPSIEAAKRLAALLDTTVAYLLDEAGGELLADARMLARLRDIAALPDDERHAILTTVDHFIKAAKVSAL